MVLFENDMQQTGPQIGARVRVLRRERGLTLKGLGALAGLSHPFLSQLERGLALPSVGSIERIARALDVPVGDLWSAPASHPLTTHVVRRLDVPLEPLTPGAARLRDLTAGGAVHVREWSGGRREFPVEPWVETGEVTVYVVRGSVELEVDEERYTLAEGDTVAFDGARPHRLRRLAGPSTRALLVTAG